MLHGDADSDHDHCKRRQQTPWRNAVHTGANVVDASYTAADLPLPIL
jgi:hypothetical protein